MRKKLLITMGCSLTEGIGCYDYSKMSEMVPYEALSKVERPIQLNRFHELGWPNRVGKKLGFDKVLNIGHGGTSNEAQLSAFNYIIVPQIKELKKTYDIFLIWLMTETTRFSFYREGRVVTFHPRQYSNKLEKGFVEAVVRHELIPEISQMNVMINSEFIFKSLDINYVFTSWCEEFTEVYKYFDTDHYLTPHPDNIKMVINPLYQSRVCTHPNEKGYEEIAAQILENIKTYHPHFNVGKEREELEWEYGYFIPKFNTQYISYFKK